MTSVRMQLPSTQIHLHQIVFDAQKGTCLSRIRRSNRLPGVAVCRLQVEEADRDGALPNSTTEPRGA